MNLRFHYVKVLYAGALAAGVIFGAAMASSAHSVGIPHTTRLHSFGTASRTATFTGVRALEAAQKMGRVDEPLSDRSLDPGSTPYVDRPWIEGFDPAREDALFRASYSLLPSHNILKIYYSQADSYAAAGIRFSARLAHSKTDLDREEMEREAAALIRTAFDQFPDLQSVDVWATIPVGTAQLMSTESTVFSVSADRTTYLAIRDRQLSDEAFLAAFGRVWLAPQVPE